MRRGILKGERMDDGAACARAPTASEGVNANEEAELRRLEGWPTSGAAMVDAFDADMLQAAVVGSGDGSEAHEEGSISRRGSSIEKPRVKLLQRVRCPVLHDTHVSIGVYV